MEKTNGPAKPLLLVSDLDDTIKISHTQSKLITIYRGLFRSSAFAGMAQLYNELLLYNTGSEFRVVSSSPPQIRGKIEAFLASNGFPEATLVLRDWFRQSSILKYKLGAILALVEKSDRPVLLIGDDTEHDPEVFAHAAKRFPEKVAARYLRKVKGRDLPEGSQGFFTAFEVACWELSAGRLSSAEVLRVGDAVLRAQKSPRLIPWFSIKPPLQYTPFANLPDSPIIELWKRIQEKIEAIPRPRNKK